MNASGTCARLLSPASLAQWLNVHVDFPLLQRIALPITVGSVRYPGTKIHDVRVIQIGRAHV